MYTFFSLWLCSCQETAEENTTPPKEPSAEKAQIKEKPTSTKELRVFFLSDGTKITGALEGTNETGFIVHSKSMGTIIIPSTELLKMTSVSESIVSEEKSVSQEQETPAPTRNIISTPYYQNALTQNVETPSSSEQENKPSSLMQNGANLQISAIQDAIMQDPEILGALYTLQKDPEVMRMIQDPEIVMLIQQQDYQGLMKHPAIKKLESNKAVQSILKSISH